LLDENYIALRMMSKSSICENGAALRASFTNLKKGISTGFNVPSNAIVGK